jgi:hypothetical protein
MLIIDRHPLEKEALNNKSHNLYDCAQLVDQTLSYLKSHYKDGLIRFNKIGYPKHTEGADSRFRKLPKIVEPATQWRIPLKAYVAIGDLGKHTWMCCLDTPDVLPNGLHDFAKFSKRKAISVEEVLVVDIEKQPDLAFFLYKISPFVKREGNRGIFQILDPLLDDSALGEEELSLTETKYAVWNMLKDESKLKTMARAYGMNSVDSMLPNAIRKELEALLIRNDKAKRQNPAVKGTKEFIEEMKVTDGLLLRNFMQKAIDDKKLSWKGDGRWKIGEKIICQVPTQETLRRNDYLCNWLMAGNNEDKLKSFIFDLVNKEYLDAIPATKDGRREWEWFAKVSGENPAFKKTEEIKDFVYKTFCPLG